MLPERCELSADRTSNTGKPSHFPYKQVPYRRFSGLHCHCVKALKSNPELGLKLMLELRGVIGFPLTL